jgi:hypothetical protein
VSNTPASTTADAAGATADAQAKERAERRAEARAVRRAARRAAERRRERRAARKRAVAAAAAKKQSSAVDDAKCDSNYSGACLDPNASDYDCSGGSGDGPEYTSTVRVVGDDHYDLDRDGDGIACDS